MALSTRYAWVMSAVPEPTALGRDNELRLILDGIDAARSASGRALALSGPAGAGKTCLVHEAIAAASGSGLNVFAGRAVPGAPTATLRPMLEALLAADRESELLGTAELGPYRQALRTLIPDGSDPDPGEPEFSVRLAEGLVRYFEHLGAKSGILLVQEDMQWADQDSVLLLEYLVDHIAGLPCTLLVTSRDEPASIWGARQRALRSRGSIAVVELGPLGRDAVADLAARSLDATVAPVGLVDWLLDWSEGNPGSAVALLERARDAGDLRDTAAGWEFTVPDRLRHDLVPMQAFETIRASTADLELDQLRILGGAAALGRRFDARLLARVCDRSADEVETTLRGLVDRRVLETDDGETSTHQFADAVTYGAVLADQVGNRRGELAAAALELVRTDHPGLPGAWCGYGAELAVAAGDRGSASELLAEQGRRHLQSGRVTDAITTLRRARVQASTVETRAAADRLLVRALLSAGDLDEALRLGTSLLGVLEGDSSVMEQVEMHLSVARAAIEMGRHDTARSHLDNAAALAEGAGAQPPAAVGRATARVALVEAALALALDEDADASSHARSAAARLAGIEPVDGGADPAWADAISDADLANLSAAAHELLGQVQLSRDLRAAEAEFRIALRTAEDHGLPMRRMQALHSLGNLEALESLRTEHLDEARRAAGAAGAELQSARIDLSLSVVRTLQLDLDPAMDLALRAEQAGRDRGAGRLVGRALALQAVNHALAGRSDDMERAISDALQGPDIDPWTEAFLWGQARAEYSLGREDRKQALTELDIASKAVSASGLGPWPMRGMWALLRTIEDRDGASARAEVSKSSWGSYPLVRAHLHYAEAIAHGRAGEIDQAQAAFTEGERAFGQLEGADWLHHRAWRLVAEAAIADRWGDPAGWLRTALQTFVTSRHTELAAVCRSMLRRLGVPVPRQRSSTVNPMAPFGITARELEVLHLMSEEMSGSDIGRRLGISTRTVEKHIERLKTKTSTRTKRDLIDWLTRHS